MRARQRLYLALTAVLVLVTLLAATVSHAQECPRLPDDYQPHYDYLKTALAEFNAHLETHGDHLGGAVRFGAELLPANGNRGRALLHHATLPATEIYLSRLQAIGFVGVKVQINYPLLRPDYPNAAQYLDFYRAVAAMVRERDMRLMIEVGPLFSGTIFSEVAFNYDDMTTDQYFTEIRAMHVTIAEELRPDYLALSSEPDTVAMLTGLAFDADDYVAHVAATIDALPPGDAMRVGAGMGTWDREGYFERFLAMPGLDFINLHMYPVATPGADLLQRALEQSRQARQVGKQIIIGETWLEKTLPSDYLGNYDFEEALSRSVYCFWSPLDSAYIETMAQFAADQDIPFVSFFWSHLFFAYRHDDDLTLTPAQRQGQDLSRRVFDNAVDGLYSPTGEAVRALLGVN